MNAQQINISRLQEADLNGKVVLIRVDHNVVKKGIIHDPFRIDQTIATLYYINSRGGRPILMSHVGRPKDKKTGNINISDSTSVEPITRYLEKKLHAKFVIPEFEAEPGKGYPGIGDSIRPMIEDLKERKIDGIYLPNTRWFRGEQAKGDESEKFAKDLAGLADIFVNDAFGSWQPHTSTVGVNKHLPSYAGFLMQKEIVNLHRIFEPERPFTAVIAGSKFDTKIDSMVALLKLADHVLMGGVMYNAYLAARYDLNIKGLTDEDIAGAKQFVEIAEKHPGKVVELPFIIESDILDGKKEGMYREHNIYELKKGSSLNYVLDVSPRSFSDEKVKKVFNNTAMFFVNAVMGLVPYFSDGTKALNEAIEINSNASKLFGGGDTLQELKRLNPAMYYSAMDDDKSYMFTGGGAVLKAIQEGNTEGIEPVKALMK